MNLFTQFALIQSRETMKIKNQFFEAIFSFERRIEMRSSVDVLDRDDRLFKWPLGCSGGLGEFMFAHSPETASQRISRVSRSMHFDSREWSICVPLAAISEDFVLLLLSIFKLRSADKCQPSQERSAFISRPRQESTRSSILTLDTTGNWQKPRGEEEAMRFQLVHSYPQYTYWQHPIEIYYWRWLLRNIIIIITAILMITTNPVRRGRECVDAFAHLWDGQAISGGILRWSFAYF